VGQIKIQGVCNLKVVMQDRIKIPMNHKSKLLLVVEKNDMELDQNNNSSNPVAPKKLFSRNCLPFFCPLFFAVVFFSFATFEYHKITIYCRISEHGWDRKTTTLGAN
jgi:hypothetical protein